MSNPLPLNSVSRILAIAYAGTDLQVHLVCKGFRGKPFSLTCDYPAFARLLREKANRGQTVRLLQSFRGVNQSQTAGGMRSWTLINVVDVLGCELTLDNLSGSMQTPLQSAA